MAERLPFLITIDTEGDNLWARPREITTKNTRFLPRFQFLCEKYGFKPVYLTNYEMARDPEFVEMARDWIRRGKAEVGMHLHAWNSPPEVPLSSEDFRNQPYLIDFPDQVMEDKIRQQTELLETVFERKVVSHRAGRWAMDERYFALLAQFGYKVDCSVTPHVSWEKDKGHPTGPGGSNYLNYPEKPYLTPQGILEIPMTIREIPRGALWNFSQRFPKVSGLVRRLWPQKAWFRPNGMNLKALQEIVEWVQESKRTHLEFMLHSSEFMPGGSPYFPNKASVERLFDHLETLFEVLVPAFEGMTLEEFHQRFAKQF